MTATAAATETAPVGYVPDSGRYPYRIDGLRLSDTEAETYLVETYGESPIGASRRVEMARLRAAHAAISAGIAVERSYDATQSSFFYRIICGQHRGRLRTDLETRQVLEREYRHTPTEVEDLISSAATVTV